MELGALVYGNSDGPTKKAGMAALRFLSAMPVPMSMCPEDSRFEGINKTWFSGKGLRSFFLHIDLSNFIIKYNFAA